ncbi:hypothetical protein BDD12DRAFT_887260 [Trichophaea hybrida]|nr:hypothetical protein BDD12DRAFT_887260 [Trichophaea hybrida]
MAVQNQREVVVRLLLDYGARIKAQSSVGLTVLQMAKEHGMDRLLLDCYAKIEAQYGLASKEENEDETTSDDDEAISDKEEAFWKECNLALIALLSSRHLRFKHQPRIHLHLHGNSSNTPQPPLHLSSQPHKPHSTTLHCVTPRTRHHVAPTLRRRLQILPHLSGRPLPLEAKTDSPSRTSTSPPNRRKTQTPSCDAGRRDSSSVLAACGHLFGGQHIMTQVVHAQQYLKEKERPLLPSEVASYLSIPITSEVFTVLRENKNPRIFYDSVADTLEFRPLHNIRSPTDLLAFLQRQTTAQGLPVKELKEGWAGALDAIDTLEEAGDILVIRTKKENLPRMVWGNDKTLFCDVDDEFKTLWHGIKIPQPAEIVGELEAMGLKPASVDPSTLKVEVKRQQKRKRAVNRRGKVSNVHMSGILKDSKDLRK